MSKSNAPTLELVSAMISILEKAPAGYTATPARLAREAFPDGLPEGAGLTGAAIGLYGAAETQGMLLETPYRHGEPVGLPENIGFTIYHKQPGLPCPYCASRDTAENLYGSPVFSEELEQDEREHRTHIAGCKVTPFAEHHCFACKKDFHRPVSSVRFERCARTPGLPETIGVRKDGDRFFLECGGPRHEIHPPVFQAEFERLADSLFTRWYVQLWPEHSEPERHMVLDGERWELAVTFDNGETLVRSGYAARPPKWTALYRYMTGLVRKYTVPGEPLYDL